MRRILVVIFLLAVFATPGGAQEGEEQILPEEVIYEAAETEDAVGANPIVLYEDPATVDCDATSWCDSPEYQNATAEAA